MESLRERFVEQAGARVREGCVIRVVDEDTIEITATHASGTVTIYRFEGSPEIVEMRASDAMTDEPLFFLHFELDDLARALELFDEMLGVVGSRGEHTTTRVLLCCTAGMTTTLFASKLQEAAKTLSLDYIFDALPFEQVSTTEVCYDAVMLAPQIGFRRREVASAFPDAVVFEIPPKVFGSFDAGGALRMLMGLIGDRSLSTPDPTDPRIARSVVNDKRVLLISVIKHTQGSTIAWRLFDRFELVAADVVHKQVVDYRDLEDVRATLHLRDIDVDDIDAVGIALPGSVNYGRVTYGGHTLTGVDIEQVLREKFGVSVFVDNNANAAAVGCYVMQDAYDSVVLHTQQAGLFVGGEGVVANGHLLRGRSGMAGEIGPFYHRVFLDEEDRAAGLDKIEDRLEDIVWRTDRMLPILATMLIATICVVAPDAIYVSYDLVDDMDQLRAEIAKSMPEESIPDLIHIDDYHDRIFVGEMALVLQRLNAPVKQT